MKTLHILFFLFCFMSFSASAQTVYSLGDTAYAYRLLKEGRGLFDKRQFDSSLVKVDSAHFIFEKVLGKETMEVAKCLYEKGYALLKLNMFDKALSTVEKALTIQLKNFSDKHSDIAKSYYLIGNIHHLKGQFNKAIDYYQKAIGLKLLIRDSMDFKMVSYYEDIGDAYSRKGENNQAIEYQQKVLKIRLSVLGMMHPDVFVSLTNLGYSYYDSGENDTALAYWQKALDIGQKVFKENDSNLGHLFTGMAEYYSDRGEYDKAIEFDTKAMILHSKQTDGHNSSVNIASDLNNIATSYAKKGEYKKALDYHQKALDIRQKVLVPTHPDIAVSLHNLGNAFERKGDYDKALEYWLKSLNIRLQTMNPTNPKLAMGFSGLGKGYYAKGEYDKACFYLQKALDIRLNKLATNPLDVASSLADLGTAYLSKKEYDKGFDCLQKALNIRQEKLDSMHPDLAYSLSSMASYYHRKKNYEKTIEYAQKAFQIFLRNDDKAGILENIANLHVENKNYLQADSLFQKSLLFINFITNQNLEKIDNIDKLTGILASKANFERTWYKETKDTTHLNQSIQTYQAAIAAIDYQKKTFTTEGSKTALQNATYGVYEGAIQTNLLLADLNKNESLKKQAFDYSEQSKANLLQAQIKESDALKYAGIPDSLLQKEYDLRVSITWREKQRQEKINGGKSETDSSVLALSSLLFDLHEQYEILKQTFEKNYPDYYRLKYDYKTVDIAEVQQKLLSKDQSMLSYFVGDSSIFAFVIKQDTFAVFDFQKDFPLESWIKQLRDGLYGSYTVAVKTEKLHDAKADSFAVAAFQLHQKLIAPLSNLLTPEVIIIPDGVLGYVPFDVLLTESPKDASKFKKHSYFGKDHIISYNYSATLWQEMQNKKHKVEPQKNFIGFAPYYNGDTTLLSNLFSYDMAMRKGLDSLKNSGEEVFKAQKLMHGESIMDKKATKETFEKIAGEYRIVHLATHGKANDKIGDYCFLAFTEQKDSIDNELLYVRDIYNLSLNADLVVLSACETGIGELKRGEGIVSLSRAFAYAGAKSMVTTLWSVNDKSTMHIMEGFYKQLKQGKTKDYALWKAKQEYLDKVKDDLAHPYFWSAFIPIGDMSALKK